MPETIELAEDEILSSPQYQDLWTDYLALQEENSHLENELYEFSCYGICDVDTFKYRLRQHDLLTAELEQFVDYYMKFYNKEDL